MNKEKPPKGWSKRHWELAQNATALAVAIERERCARIAERAIDYRFVAKAIREG